MRASLRQDRRIPDTRSCALRPTVQATRRALVPLKPSAGTRCLDCSATYILELATGELVVGVRNAAGFGPGGRGYLLVTTVRQ